MMWSAGSPRSPRLASTRVSSASGRSCAGRTRAYRYRVARPRSPRRSSEWCGRCSSGSAKPGRRFPAVRQDGDLDGHLSGRLGDGLDLIDEHRSVRAERRRQHHLDLGLFGREGDLANEVEVDHRETDLGVEDRLQRIQDLLLLFSLGDYWCRLLLIGGFLFGHGFSLLPPQPGHKAQNRGQQDAQHDRRRERRIDRPAVAPQREVTGKAADERHAVGDNEQHAETENYGANQNENATELSELHTRQLSHLRVTRRTRSSSAAGTPRPSRFDVSTRNSPLAISNTSRKRPYRLVRSFSWKRTVRPSGPNTTRCRCWPRSVAKLSEPRIGPGFVAKAAPDGAHVSMRPLSISGSRNRGSAGAPRTVGHP